MISDLSKSCSIPKKFLEQILLDLKHHDLERSKCGGYQLNLQPCQIMFGEVLRIVDGPIALLPCLSKISYRRCADCLDEATCEIWRVFADVAESSRDIFDNTSLLDAMTGRDAGRKRLVKKKREAPFPAECNGVDTTQTLPQVDGARGSTTTFAQRAVGDVLISWENEAFLVLQEFGADKFDVVVPSLSILAEPPVTVVDAVVDKRGTRKAAEAYLNFLYSPAGQKIIAKNFYRPCRPEDADPADLARFPKIKLVTIDQVFGGWKKAQSEHFAEGAIFDQIYKPSGKAPR